MSRFSSWMYRHVPGLHPGMDLLISYAEGCSSGVIDAHIAHCERCGRTAQLIASAIRAAREPRQASASITEPLLHETLDQLRLQMRAWCSVGGLEQRERHASRALPHSHVAKALEFYFGKQVADRMGSCTWWEAAGHPLTAVTNPMFKAFLGKRAADAVARQIASPTA